MKNIFFHIPVETNLHEWIMKSLNNQNGFNNISNTLSNRLCFGKMRLENLQSGLSYCLSDLRFKQNVLFKKSKCLQKKFCIYFLNIVKGNEVYVYKEGKQCSLAKGQKNISFIAPSEMTIEIKIENGTHIEILTIECSEEWGEIYFDHPEKGAFQNSNTTDLRYYQERNFSSEINHLFKKIYHRLRDNNLYSLLSLHSYIYLITDATLRVFFKSTVSPGFPRRNVAEEFEKLAEIASILSAETEKGFPSIKCLAKQALMSESKLKSRFKEVYGMTLYQYYQEKRMKLAKELLSTGNFKVSEIAYKIGFSSLSNFSLAFKREFDLLPKMLKPTCEIIND